MNTIYIYEYYNDATDENRSGYFVAKAGLDSDGMMKAASDEVEEWAGSGDCTINNVYSISNESLKEVTAPQCELCHNNPKKDDATACISCLDNIPL